MEPEKLHNILNGTVEKEQDLEPVVNALNAVNKEFANSIGVAVSYFQTSDAVDKIDRIILAGGYALVPGLINMLELRTGAEVVVLNPFIEIGYDAEKIAGLDMEKVGIVYAVAMGLATRTF